MNQWRINILLFCTSVIAYGQSFKEEKGSLSVLKNQTEVNVIFDYSKLRLMKANLTEEEYIQDRVQYLNQKKKGESEYWVNNWKNAKSFIWEPNFMKLLAKTITEKKGISFVLGENSANKYTLIVEAIWIYPGWDAGIMKKAAKVSTHLKIVETADKNNVVYQVQAIEAPGDQFGSNFNDELRIGEGFEKTAKSFGKLMIKKIK